MIDNLGTPASPRLVVDYGYDAVGHGTTVTDNFGVSVASAYDARDLLTARTWSGGGVAAAKVVMGYDGAGQWVAVGRFRDVAGTQAVAATAEGYDAAGRLARRATARADGTPLVDYRYAYNLAGEVTQESSHGASADYAYDLAGQVVAAARPASPGEAYAYDASGNAAGPGRAGPSGR